MIYSLFVVVLMHHTGTFLYACNVKFSCSYFNTCTLHILLHCTMINNCTFISQILILLHVSSLLCHPQGACNEHLPKLHKYFKCSCW